MNEKLQIQVDAFVKNIESRQQSEKMLALAMLSAGLLLAWLWLFFDPARLEIDQAASEINNVERQIQAQQTAYAAMVELSKEDPNKFDNDRIQVIAREQMQMDRQLADLAGDLVSPNQMTAILTSVLARQAGLRLLHFQNKSATPLRVGLANASQVLQEAGAVNFGEIAEGEFAGQVYQHGLIIEFQGDFFNTLKYLRFLEEITGSFFWDAISFRQPQWPDAHVTLEIHTLSTDEGFIGV